MTEALSRVTLLSNMSNTAPSDNVVLRQAVEQIQRCLPGRWTTAVSVKPRVTGGVACAGEPSWPPLAHHVELARSYAT